MCLPTSLSIHQNHQNMPQSLELIAGRDQKDLCALPSAVSTCKDSLEAGRWIWKVRKGVPPCAKQDGTVLSGACHLLTSCPSVGCRHWGRRGGGTYRNAGSHPRWVSRPGRAIPELSLGQVCHQVPRPGSRSFSGSWGEGSGASSHALPQAHPEHTCCVRRLSSEESRGSVKVWVLWEVARGTPECAGDLLE